MRNVPLRTTKPTTTPRCQSNGGLQGIQYLSPITVGAYRHFTELLELVHQRKMTTLSTYYVTTCVAMYLRIEEQSKLPHAQHAVVHIVTNDPSNVKIAADIMRCDKYSSNSSRETEHDKSLFS